MDVEVQRGLQSIISDLRLLDPNIELQTLWGLWFCYQFANKRGRKEGKWGLDALVVMVALRQVLVGCDESNNVQFLSARGL